MVERLLCKQEVRGSIPLGSTKSSPADSENQIQEYAVFMSEIQSRVKRFYDEIWNDKNFQAADELLSENVLFRGSLGSNLHGRTEFLDYVSFVTRALSGYHCEIDDIVSEGPTAAVKMTFSGLHVGDFLGHSPTLKTVEWQGAAFFTEKDGKFTDIWVLGDLYALMKMLGEQSQQK